MIFAVASLMHSRAISTMSGLWGLMASLIIPTFADSSATYYGRELNHPSPTDNLRVRVQTDLYATTLNAIHLAL